MKLLKRKNGINLIQVGDSQWVVNGRGVKELFYDLGEAEEFFMETL